MPVAAGLHYFLHEGGSALSLPLVLIHGAGGDHLFWPAELRRLPGQRVFTPDLPGHGKSGGPSSQSVEDYAFSLVNFLNEVGLSRAVFAGYSMGGAVALSMALEYPERVAGIGLISTGARLPIPTLILENAANLSTFPLAIQALQEKSFGSLGDESLKEATFKRLSKMRQTLLLSDWLACDRFDVTGRLESIRTPTLVVCGTDDKLTPPHFSETLASQIPGAALQTIDGAGHMLVLEQPRRLSKLLSIFLATIP